MVKRHWKLIGLVLLIGLMACPLTYADKDKSRAASQMKQIEKHMWAAAKKLDFERAASLRDKLKQLKMASQLEQTEKQMWDAAKKLDFERAASLRDKLKKLKDNDHHGDDDDKHKKHSKCKKKGKDDDDEDEEEVSINKVPKAVKATILKHAKGGKVEEIKRKKNVIYEADVIIGGKEVELKVAPCGKLLGKKVEDEDDEADEDDDDEDDDERCEDDEDDEDDDDEDDDDEDDDDEDDDDEDDDDEDDDDEDDDDDDDEDDDECC